MKKNSAIFFISFLMMFVASGQNTRINASVTYQTMAGLGVNINPQSWNVNPDSVKKVLDSLVFGLGCTSFRLMYDDCDWEVRNDNNDPNVYNWGYYDSVYSAPRFTCVWNTIEYLNSKGISDITLSPDGAAPSWMGGTTLHEGFEEEYAEMMSSMVNYGLKRRVPAIHFVLLSPINETTCGGNEGAAMKPEQLAAVFANIAKHLIDDHLDKLSLIGPDDCQGWAANYHAMVSNSLAMSKIFYFGQHDYGDETKKIRDLVDSIKHSSYPDRGAIMTEANAVCKDCDGGTYNSSYGFTQYAGPAYKFILQHINAGANGVLIWEGYDSRYHHPNRTLTWSMWGIYGVNDTLRPDVYTVRNHYYTFKQLYRFVKPGCKRIQSSTELAKMTISAFFDPKKKTLVITGKNDSDRAQTIQGIVENIPGLSTMKYYFTDETHSFFRGSDVKLNHKSFSKSIPPSSVFTFVANR
ncbi:MAG: hypothetical protein JST75_14790 [Bacteroidetes bacterium]|nr:hypothetical protein [Bacteroidota bacterium]